MVENYTQNITSRILREYNFEVFRKAVLHTVKSIWGLEKYISCYVSCAIASNNNHATTVPRLSRFPRTSRECLEKRHRSLYRIRNYDYFASSRSGGVSPGDSRPLHDAVPLARLLSFATFLISVYAIFATLRPYVESQVTKRARHHSAIP